MDPCGPEDKVPTREVKRGRDLRECCRRHASRSHGAPRSTKAWPQSDISGDSERAQAASSIRLNAAPPPASAGPSGQNSWACTGQALRTPWPHIAPGYCMNIQAHSPYSFEDTRDTYWHCLELARATRALRSPGPDTAVSSHPVQRPAR